MSLNFSYANVADVDALFETATETDQMRGRRAGEQYMTVRTETLIMSMMAVGMDAITTKNAAEYWTRLSMIERCNGAWRASFVDGKRVSVYFTADDVLAHVGLTSNASRLTKSQFLARLYDVRMCDAAAEMQRVEGR